MRASLSWISWNSPMGLPNCTRSFEYCTHSSRHLSMIPSDIAATPERSMENVSLAPSRPPDGTSSVSPMSRSRPTRTSERNSSPVGELCIPILRSGFDCSSPGIPLSSTKLRILRWSAGTSAPSSSLQMNTIVSA